MPKFIVKIKLFFKRLSPIWVYGMPEVIIDTTKFLKESFALKKKLQICAEICQKNDSIVFLYSY